jgi:hypothetical protein
MKKRLSKGIGKALLKRKTTDILLLFRSSEVKPVAV